MESSTESPIHPFRFRNCFHERGKNIWKQTVLRGLKQQYTNNEQIRQTIQKLLALPFVPEEDVAYVFDTTVGEVPEDIEDEEQLMKVINYVKPTYIKSGAAQYYKNQSSTPKKYKF